MPGARVFQHRRLPGEIPKERGRPLLSIFHAGHADGVVADVEGVQSAAVAHVGQRADALLRVRLLHRRNQRRGLGFAVASGQGGPPLVLRRPGTHAVPFFAHRAEQHRYVPGYRGGVLEERLHRDDAAVERRPPAYARLLRSRGRDRSMHPHGGVHRRRHGAPHPVQPGPFHLLQLGDIPDAEFGDDAPGVFP